MPLGTTKEKFDLRILIEDSHGGKTSYISQSIFNSNVDSTMTVSESDMHDRITVMTSCSWFY